MISQEEIYNELEHLCTLPDSGYDQKLADAAKEVLATGRLTPLIKEELRTVIQSRRLSMGKEEMEVDFRPPESHQLSKEEQAKKAQRKERNKIAARRHRQKKKEESHKLEQMVKQQENKQKKLLEEIKKLTDEKNALIEALGQIHSHPV